MGKDKKQTVTQRLDPRSQGHVNRIRGQATQAADEIGGLGPLFLGPDGRSIEEQIAPFMNPYIHQVLGGLGQQFDHLRSGARTDAAQAATSAGAFNSTRHGVAEGVRLGELDRTQTQQTAGLLSSGFQSALTQGLQFSEYQRALRERQMQEPIFRRQVQQGFLTGGLGPTGQTTQQIQHGNLAGDIAGLGLMGLGLATGGPGGAAAASQVGGGSSFQPGGLFSGFDPRVYNRARMGVGG